MIPRRRTNDEIAKGDAPSVASKSNASLSSPFSEVAAIGSSPAANGTATTTATTAATNSINSPRNRRILTLILLCATAAAWVSRSEKKLLDSGDYTNARKEYLKKNSHHNRYSTLENYHRNPNAPSGKFVLQPENEFTPAIAWLMSFPNSGTSFTMTMVARSTNKSFATNYGDEVIAPDDPDSLSIYPRRPEGPYWPGLSGKMHTPRDLPDKYVITKTHCGSRCSDCGPATYVETPKEFLRRCTLGHARLTPAKERRKYDVEYPYERVHKAIHLIRNPMHNIIARYHLEHRHKGYKNDTQWQENHSNDANGLKKWCKANRNKYKTEDEAFFRTEIPKAPCHGEFYKWTQWHNLAHASLAIMRGGAGQTTAREVPRLRVYYEDYKKDFETTAHQILDFLELEQVAPFREFRSRSDYGGYYSDKELRDIKKLVQSVASEETWKDVRHYFKGV